MYVFLPRTAMHKHSLCHCAVQCLSVRLSRSWTVSKQKKHIFSFFPPTGSHTIPVFFVPNIMAMADRASNADG